MNTRVHNDWPVRLLAICIACVAPSLSLAPARSAVIGVLNDGRQLVGSSLFEQTSAARVALEADGHAIIELGSGSLLAIPVLQAVDVVWLPLLNSTDSYTPQEQVNLSLYAFNGGRVIWIGDADVFNTADDSFLTALGLSKLAGNFGDPLTPLSLTHPALSGPHGTVQLVGTNASYGIFTGAADVADLFVDAAGQGTVVGLMDATSGYAGAGRVTLVSSSKMFGQLLLQDDHMALLRNVVKWAAAAPGYTPVGFDVAVGPISNGCDLCTATTVVFSQIIATGETFVFPIATGRCDFSTIPASALPNDFVGSAFELSTTATLAPGATVGLTIAYNPAQLSAIGILDDASLRLYQYDPQTQTTTDLATTLDTGLQTISATSNRTGIFLLGAALASADCNANGLPDVCEIDANSTAPGGPFFCTSGCDPDCNKNGIPDSCDISSGTSQDCNANGLPDACEISISSTAPGGPFHCLQNCDPDCNDNGVPDACDISALTSIDCNANGVPDECESTVTVSLIATPSNGGTAEAGTPGPYPVCTMLPITATPAAGYCFSDWTVDVGAAPADSNAAQTTVATDRDKTVTAHFTKIITSQSQSLGSCLGDQATFSVEVSASLSAEVTFQWQRDGVDLLDGGSVSGATAAALDITPIADIDVGSYTCVVKHPCGTVTSDPVVLGLTDEVQIITDPADQTACPGDAVQFDVTASATALTYQWQLDTGSGFLPLTDAADISGSATPTLQLSNVSAALAGQYRCEVAGLCGPAKTSAPASLTVGVETSIIADPTDQAMCPGDSVTFTVSAGGTNLQYQWRFDDGATVQDILDGPDVSGATTDTLSLTNVSTIDEGTYTCLVTADCGTPLLSNPAALTIGQGPQILTDPVSQSRCPGDTAIFTTQATGTAPTYQWQANDSTGFVDLVDGPAVSGAQSTTLSIQNLTDADATTYRCVVMGACGSPATTAEAGLTVQAIVSVTQQPAGSTACPGEAVVFSVSATGINLTYQWQFNDGTALQNVDGADPGTSGAQSDTLTLTNVTAAAGGDYQCVVSGDCGPVIISDIASLVVSIGICDCNANGVADSEDISTGSSSDCNTNGLPDDCEIADGTLNDCNLNGIPDDCDMAGNGSADCNGNNILDECEIDLNSPAPGGPFFCLSGCAIDCNDDGIPDSCQLAGNDCNGNGILDQCESPFIADAGPDITLCVGEFSLPLGGTTVAAGSTPPYSFAWSILSGPAGGGEVLSPTAERARFHPTLVGTYIVQLEVSDASVPSCVVSDSLTVGVYELIVDAGDDLVMCSGATSAVLSPTITGGVGTLSHQWTIEPGSPSTNPSQLTGAGPTSQQPTLTPDSPGQYTLRLTVSDANNPSCQVSDTVTVIARLMTIGAPADFQMCVSGESVPLAVTIISPGTPPYTHDWSIAAGSPDLSSRQFGGNGPTSADPTFVPTSVGTYQLAVTVTDSTVPPCEVSRVVTVTTSAMTVDAGGQNVQCVGGNGVRLAPIVTGGVPPLLYSWTIEPGSPSVDPAQFTDPHPFDPAPLFVPAALGSYTLRLTVTDSGSPPCVAGDTVVVRSTSMTVDAGADFVTQAFQPSRPLGVFPIVGGGDPPFVYDWEIIVGPVADPAQLSATDVAQPSFTPAETGTYTLQVTVTDANGTGCAVSDRVTLEAISAARSMSVNIQGRLFMTLRINEPKTSAELRLLDAQPGVMVSGALRDDGPAAKFGGLITTPSLTRRIRLQSDLTAGSYVALIIMRYDDAEIASLDEGQLRLQRWSEAASWWFPATTGPIEAAPYPIPLTRADMGRSGVDRQQKMVWAVVSAVGEFAIGVPSGEQPTAAALTGDPLSTAPSDTPDIFGTAIPLCGAFGTGMIYPLMLLGFISMRRRRARK